VALDFAARVMALLCYGNNPCRNFRSLRLPELTSPNLFLLGYPKEKVYKKKPRKTEALKGNIRLGIANYEKNVLRRTASNMERRVQVCLEEGGSHFIV
jgi:hypothetical protein